MGMDFFLSHSLPPPLQSAPRSWEEWIYLVQSYFASSRELCSGVQAPGESFPGDIQGEGSKKRSKKQGCHVYPQRHCLTQTQCCLLLRLEDTPPRGPHQNIGDLASFCSSHLDLIISSLESRNGSGVVAGVKRRAQRSTKQKIRKTSKG